jgi:hypothetical protein
MLLTVTGFAVAGFVGSCLWWMWSMWVMRGGMMGEKGKRGLWRRITGKERYKLIVRIA